MSVRDREDQMVVDTLGAVGINVESVFDLVNTNAPYPEAIPALVALLEHDFEDLWIAEGVVRALGVKEARDSKTREALLKFFIKLPPGTELIGWAVGNALETIADDSILGDLIYIAKEKKYGSARKTFVSCLAKMKDPHADRVLIDLLEDEEVTAHAIEALAKRKCIRALPEIEKLLDHPHRLIKKEATKAVKKLRKNRT